jgi:hypothetical protein
MLGTDPEAQAELRAQPWLHPVLQGAAEINGWATRLLTGDLPTRDGAQSWHNAEAAFRLVVGRRLFGAQSPLSWAPRGLPGPPWR